jgi:L-proline amide hydrolase
MPDDHIRLDLIPELGSTWCRVVDAGGDRIPILLLHGGPGYNSEYLRRFECFARTGRTVVRYDQIGAGRSIVDDEHYRAGVFTVELFRRELSELRRVLDLDDVFLIGQSWGTMLALEHVLDGAEGVRGMVLMSGPASLEEWTIETHRLRSELPVEVREVLEREEAEGRVGSPAFKEAYAVWERTHVLRMDEPPPWEVQALSIFESDTRVYDLTTGGAEFPTEGTTFELEGWDVRPRLHEIEVPTLLLSGRYDEATPAVMATLHRGIAGSEWHILEESSHSCHTEEESLTMLLVADFLARCEGSR